MITGTTTMASCHATSSQNMFTQVSIVCNW